MESWLRTLDAQPDLLLEWMQARHTRRLGHYAEHLLEFYLSKGPTHTLHAARIQLQSPQGVTQGEMDFLLTDMQGRRLHWELAVKFFLCMSSASSITAMDFLGPNGVETLAHKWHKVFERQLACMPPAPWSDHPWQAQAFTRGWMFYRWGSAVPTCDALHPAHCKGWWIDHAQMHQLPVARYLHLPRLQWMAPVTLAAIGADEVAHEREAMAEHLAQYWASNPGREDAQMVVQLTEGADTSDQAQEIQRFFIRRPYPAPGQQTGLA